MMNRMKILQKYSNRMLFKNIHRNQILFSFFFSCRSYTQDDSYQIHMPSNVPTPPSSPHMDFLRQQNYFQPSIYQYLMAQQYRLLHDRQQQQQQYGYSMIEGRYFFYVWKETLIINFFLDEQKRNDLIIDEHFRKSLGDNYNKYSSRCLTPDDSSSNSSSTAVDSIEEHFARSLAKFQPLNQDETTTINHHVNESVDDHFAKALGTKTWQKLKEKN